MTEIHNIEERFQRRKLISRKENFYYSYFSCSERELKYAEIIKSHFGSKIQDLKLLEIGAGGGDNLLFFHRKGFSWSNIYANELLKERIEMLKDKLSPVCTILEGDASNLDYSEFFDVCFISTVFTSILDMDFKKKLAEKCLSMIKNNGLIIWYDFKFDNPRNPDVKGVGVNELKKLFSKASRIEFMNVTLAPPIGRKAGKFYNFINFLFPFLRTHLIAVIKKSDN